MVQTELQVEDRADALLGKLGFTAWRPGQREAVEAALEGRDSLIVMPTGGGKSLCYQLPGLATEDLTIVVSPLIALMNDQWRRLSGAGHPVAMVTSAMSEEAVRQALAQVRGGAARIVYCSPERFASGVFLEAIGQRRIDLLAVDEAHCVSEWGHDFRPDYLRLPEIAERLGRPTVMACTATATEAVAREIAARFQMREPLQVRSGFDRPSLSFDVVRLEGKGSKARRTALLEAGLADPANRPAIVYCGTRRDTDEVAATLREAGLQALGYHAGMEAEDRADTQARFMSRRGRRDRRHQRLRHGRRQGRRALGLAHGDPDQPRGLLPGGRPRRARRPSRPRRAAGDEGRPRPARALQPAARRQPRPGDRPRARLARLPDDQILHLLRALPAAQRARPLRRQPGRRAARALLRRLRPAGLAARPGDDRDPPPGQGEAARRAAARAHPGRRRRSSSS